LRVEAEGADAVVASGGEAGGHVGQVATLPLVPQVVDAVKIPVIAAGGIGDARGFVAALALGACGVQIGTRFLATYESGISAVMKGKILQASEEDTVVTPILTGKPVRVIRSGAIREYDALEKAGATAEELARVAAGIRRDRQRDEEAATIASGQIAGLIKELAHAGAIVRQIVADAQQICARLDGLARG
jgi:enoyl-[acyl-carrier protein] reductase II